MIDREMIEKVVEEAVRFAGDEEQNYIGLSHEEVIGAFMLRFLQSKGVEVKW
jgi:hypothetical protein